MERSSPNEKSTSSAPGKGPITTLLPVPTCANRTDAHPTSTKRPAPDDPTTAPPKRIQLEMNMAWLGDLAVEAVFPGAAFIRLEDVLVSRNEWIMRRRLREGAVHRGEDVWRLLIAGSQAEGVAVERGWGHPKADMDCMLLYGEDLAVGMDGHEGLPPGGVSLIYRGEECPPAYTRLEVVDVDRLLEVINTQRNKKVVPAHTCVREEGGRQWLLSRCLLDAMRITDDNTVQGPAVTGPGGLYEVVTALVGTGPHPDMTAYTERPRTGWPSPQQIKYLPTMPILIVCVGPKGHPDISRLFRVSFSPHEITLITNLLLWVKQGYICFKHVLKALLASSRLQVNNDDIDNDNDNIDGEDGDIDSADEDIDNDSYDIDSDNNSIDSDNYGIDSDNDNIDGNDDGRSRVGSYHLKTVFLRYLEKHPPQPEGSPFQLALELCLNLQQCLLDNNISHYFIPTCNLLEKVGERERQEALSAVNKVLDDPLTAIICSPCYPEEIFGSRDRCDDLLRCFRAVSKHLTRGAAREALQLLRDLDEHRVRRYREQLEADESDDVSGRPGLVKLADHLQRNTPA